MHSPLTSVGRSADLRLRGRGGPVRVRVRWPAGPGLGSPAPVVVVLADPDATAADDAFCDALCAGLGALVLHVFWDGSLERAADALDWAADHVAELDGDPHRILVAGRDQAAVAASALTRRADDHGWPPLVGLVRVTGTGECTFSDHAGARVIGAVDATRYPEQLIEVLRGSLASTRGERHDPDTCTG